MPREMQGRAMSPGPWLGLLGHSRSQRSACWLPTCGFRAACVQWASLVPWSHPGSQIGPPGGSPPPPLALSVGDSQEVLSAV